MKQLLNKILCLTIVFQLLSINCFANEVRVIGGDMKDLQVFGDKEPFTDDRQIVYGRPLIKFLAMIQDSRDEAALGRSKFSNIELFEEVETSEETSMVRI